MIMAQYAMLVYESAAHGKPEDHDRYADYLRDSGAMVAAFVLQPGDTATTVRRDAVTDGPFVDSKEVIAGICIIEAPDFDAAVELLRASPSLEMGGALELRPVLDGGVVIPAS
jgi:hypothetical protein